MRGRPAEILRDNFSREYLVDLNGIEACRRAGYKGTNKVLKVRAFNLLNDTNVRARIEKLRNVQIKRTNIDADAVLFALSDIAHSDFGGAFDKNGCLLPILKIPEPLRKCIAGLEIEELYSGVGKARKLIGYTKKIKWWPKVEALIALGRHLKLFTDRMQLEAGASLEDLVVAAQKERVKGGSAGGK